MNNKHLLERINRWQVSEKFHDLTCNVEPKHNPLVGEEVNGIIILKCNCCGYTKDVPDFFFREDFDIVFNEQLELFKKNSDI